MYFNGKIESHFQGIGKESKGAFFATLAGVSAKNSVRQLIIRNNGFRNMPKSRHKTFSNIEIDLPAHILFPSPLFSLFFIAFQEK